jgi:hypothetical protein
MLLMAYLIDKGLKEQIWKIKRNQKSKQSGRTGAI